MFDWNFSVFDELCVMYECFLAIVTGIYLSFYSLSSFLLFCCINCWLLLLLNTFVICSSCMSRIISLYVYNAAYCFIVCFDKKDTCGFFDKIQIIFVKLNKVGMHLWPVFIIDIEYNLKKINRDWFFYWIFNTVLFQRQIVCSYKIYSEQNVFSEYNSHPNISFHIQSCQSKRNMISSTGCFLLPHINCISSAYTSTNII